MTTEEAKTGPEAVPTGVELTALHPDFQSDPYPVLERLRRLDPVHHDTLLGRYVLTRHDDVDALLWDRSLSVDPRKAAPGTFEARFTFADREVGGSKMSRAIVAEAIWKVPALRVAALFGRL